MRGNDPQRWNNLLAVLDEKLQLNLLEHLKRTNAYHFEENVLYLEPATQEEEDFWRKEAVQQQLQLHAAEAVQVEKVKIKRP